MRTTSVVCAALAASLLLLPGTTRAQVADAVGDFLPTYTGIQGGDLDVISTSVTLTPTDFLFSATMNGAIGTTTTFDPSGNLVRGLYVFGVDRGTGTPRLAAGTPSIGGDILFDAVVTISALGVGTVNTLPGATTLPSADVVISGNSLFARVPVALLPSTGFDLSAYTFNLWPRLGAGSNTQISDFAPDSGNATVTAIPEPATVALMAPILLPLLGLARRRR